MQFEEICLNMHLRQKTTTCEYEPHISRRFWWDSPNKTDSFLIALIYFVLKCVNKQQILESGMMKFTWIFSENASSPMQYDI